MECYIIAVTLITRGIVEQLTYYENIYWGNDGGRYRRNSGIGGGTPF